MTDLLERAIARVRALPPEAQEEAARLLLDFADDLAREVDAAARLLLPQAGEGPRE